MAKARRIQRRKKPKAAEPGQRVLASVARRVQRVQRLEAAAGTYLAELVPFSLPPEGIEINARPDFYVTGVFIPNDSSWTDAKACLQTLLEGKDNEREFSIGAGRIVELFHDFSLNLNYTLVRIPDKDGQWQVRQDLAFGDYVVLLESRWDRANRNVVKWFLRRQSRTWISPMSTLLLPYYDASQGLVWTHTGEDDDS